MDSIYDVQMPMIPDKFDPSVAVRILSEVIDYNHRVMNVPQIWKRTKGEKVKVAILDTGLPVHVDLSPCGSKSFIRGYLQDGCGHGTHVGGILAAISNNQMGIAGIAPECEDYYGAVLDRNGMGSISNIIDGIRWAVNELEADIINMSLGIPAGVERLKELEDACNWANLNGVTVVAAAGNEAGSVGQPACYDSVIAVAAVNDRGEHATFSNHGPEIDFAAGGVDVYSTYLNNGYAKCSGSSMASPVIAGMAALIIADELVQRQKKLSPREVYDKLKKIAFDVTGDGFDSLYGHGIPIFRNDDGISNHITPVAPVPQPPKSDTKKRSVCALAMPIIRRFVSAASVASDDGLSDEAAAMAGIKALDEFFERMESLRDAK